ncbi:MAG: glycosyltransferase [Candidatus Omnitrophota bacterium]|nr:glycosyltransferase [Candidatus Omnitrophota bacterium]
MTTNPISICYFPGRESQYSRTRVLLKGMQEAGLNVYDCSYPKKNALRYFVGFSKFLRCKHQCDVILIGFFGQFLVPLVKIFTRKKIIFEAFVSAYQTLAYDRCSIDPRGILAKCIRTIERLSCQLADIVLLDTEEHIKYFTQEYHLEKDKFYKSPVSCDTTVMYPRAEEDPHKFIVHFHGEFQALHGANYIIEAAQILPETFFQLVGKGKGLNECRCLVDKYRLTNVQFSSSVSLEELSSLMAKASVCLGIFGNTPKTQMVIPFKVYEAMAMRKAIITADTPAIRELLTHQKNAYLCRTADAQSLANAICVLRLDQGLRQAIAEQAYQTFQHQCTPKIVGEQIREFAKNLTKEPRYVR